MREFAAGQTDYGNWVPSERFFPPGALSLLFGGLSLLMPLLVVVAFIFFLCFLYFAYAR